MVFPPSFLVLALAFQAPMTEVAATWPYGDQLSLTATSDGARIFVAEGAAIAVLDGTSLGSGPPQVIARIDLEDAQPLAQLDHRDPTSGKRWLFVAGGATGLWRIDLCESLFASPPSGCTACAPTPCDPYGRVRLDIADSPELMRKRCIDVAVVEGNAAAGAPLLFALFAARSDSPIGPSELRSYRLDPDGTVTPWASLVFVDELDPTIVASALEADPDDPNHVYVALGTRWLHRVDVTTQTFFATEVEVPATIPRCSLPTCPFGEKMTDLSLVRTAGHGARMYATLDYGRLLEFDLATGAVASIGVPCGYPARVSAATDGIDRVTIVVGTQSSSKFQSESPAPYWHNGIWSDPCLTPGLADPNQPALPKCERLHFFEHDVGAGTPLEPLAGVWQPESGHYFGTLRLSRAPDGSFRVYVCTNFFGTTVYRLITPLVGDVFAPPLAWLLAPAGLSRVARHVGPAFAAVKPRGSAKNPGLFFFGHDGLGPTAGIEPALMMYIRPPAALDIVPVRQTFACPNPPTPPAGCPLTPTPFVGSLLGMANWPDPVDPRFEWFLPNTDTWLKVGPDCQPLASDCTDDPCLASSSVFWRRDFLPGATSKVGWKLVRMRPRPPTASDPTGITLEPRWWQFASPTEKVQGRTDSIPYLASQADPRTSGPPGLAVPLLVHCVRGGSDHGYEIFRTRDLMALAMGVCPADVRGYGENIGIPPYAEATTHVELELPGVGPRAQPCRVNIGCSPTPASPRALFNNKLDVFPVTDAGGAQHWISAVAAGFVSSGPSTDPAIQPASCQWDDHYAKSLLVLFDVTNATTIVGTGAPPPLLRVALGPAAGNAFSVRTKTYGSGTTSRTYAFVGDALGRLVVFDVSADQLFPAASSPYLPIDGTPTPLLEPVASITFPPDPYDGLLTNCIDLEIDGNTAYCAIARGGLAIVDVSVPTAPQLSAVLDTPGIALGVAVRTNEAGERQLVLGDSRCGVRLYRRPGE